MTLPVFHTREAERDLDDIALYIALESPKRAIAFVDDLRSFCLRLADHPDAHVLREEYGAGIRMAVHGRYLIFHAARDEALVIERIIHGSRHIEALA